MLNLSQFYNLMLNLSQLYLMLISLSTISYADNSLDRESLRYLLKYMLI